MQKPEVELLEKVRPGLIERCFRRILLRLDALSIPGALLLAECFYRREQRMFTADLHALDPDRLRSMRNFADLLQARGKYDEALKLLEEGIFFYNPKYGEMFGSDT